MDATSETRERYSYNLRIQNWEGPGERMNEKRNNGEEFPVSFM